MKDPILQEVRDAKASVAADFDFDLHKFFSWAKTHAAAEREAKHLLPVNSVKTSKVRKKAPLPKTARKRPLLPSRVSA